MATAVEQAADGIVITDAHGKIQFVNAAFSAMTGFSSDEAVGRTPRILQSGRHQQAFYEDLWNTIRSGRIWEGKLLNRRKDGTLYTEEMRIAPIFGASRETVGYVAIKRDVTAQTSAAESRMLLAKMVESSEDAIIAYKPSGEIVTWNHGAETILGYSSKEAVGKEVAMIVPPDAQGLLHINDQALRGNSISQQETVALHKDGRIIQVSVTAWPIRNPLGDVTTISIIARDISKHREAEEAQALLASIVEFSDDAIHVTDLEGSIVSWNRGAEELCGYTSEEILGKNVSILVPPREREHLLKGLTAIREGLTTRPFDATYQRKDGSVIDISLSISPIRDSEGKVVGASAIARDIGQRVRLLRELQEAGEKYRGIFDGAIEGIFQVSPDGKFLAANSALATMLGYASPNEMISSVTSLSNLIWSDPDDRAKFLQELERQGSVWRFEGRANRKDGGTVWTSLSCRGVSGADGRLLYYQGFLEDITERRRTEMQLRNSEARYRSTFEQAAVGIAHTSFGGKFLRCNARFAEIVGYPIDEVPGLTAQEITHPDDLETTAAMLQQVASGAPGATTFEKRYLRKNGAATWVKVTISTQRDADGHPVHSIALVEDINDRKAAEDRLIKAQEALRTSEARYRTVFQTSLDSVMICRMSDGQFIDVNKAFLDLVGFDYDEVIGRTFSEINIWSSPEFLKNIPEVLNENSDIRDIETQIKKKNGETFWAVVSASVIEIEHVSCLLFVMKNISAAKAAEVEIRNLAFYDSLTGLPNRRLLLDRLLQALNASSRSGRMVALMFVDLDNFKTLNDTLGHQAGDLLLQQSAQRITNCLRDTDTVARLGGDEFVVLIEGLSEQSEYAADEAMTIAEKILQAVEVPFKLYSREYQSTASVGITVFRDHLENVDDVLQKAELAMYQAKAAGRNTIRFFAPALQAAVNARAAMEDALRQAIRLDQFLLYYQPQVDRGAIVGAEALIRWKHPERGILAPGEFIVLAEETGIILPLGNWVLQEACRQIAAWSRSPETADITLAINISARQFKQPNFVEQVLTALERTGANPANLKLELTESMLLDDVEDVITKMAALKAHGLTFSLDDFGTGYSSLSYLKRLPLDQLKIDQTFVHDLLVDCRGGAIAQAIIALGRAMGLSVIAEGVETEQQRVFLAGLECHLFQGYLFSRPQPLKEFEQLIPRFAGAQLEAEVAQQLAS
jgi:diguanylate cyclase (GGDEF)-like protein/PAS domain S-box-containing protein